MEETNSYKGRVKLTNIIEENITTLFDTEKVVVVPYGVLNLLKDQDEIITYLSELSVNNKHAEMILKFAPDYLLFKKTEPKKIYFLEVKCSITPCWSEYRVNRIRDTHNNEHIDESNIGEVAREAFLSYKRYYPETIVLYGATYNRKVLMAQFANKIECLYCFKSGGEYDCNHCPVDEGEFFELERNSHSSGSKTPNTNINLDTFENANSFFDSLGISFNQEMYDFVYNEIIKAGVNLTSVKDACRKNEIIDVVNRNGCSWLKRLKAYYIAIGNDFYHSKQDCFTIREKEISLCCEEEATKGRKKCKYCNKE